MAINYATAVKTPRLQDVADLINTKTIVAATGAGSAGQLVIGTSALSGGTGVLVTLPVPNPAGTVSGVTLTLGAIPATNATTTGTAALAELRNGAGTTIASGLTVGVGGGFDVNINSVSITSGQQVTISSAVITHG